MLKIKDLKAGIEGKKILKGLNLEVGKGEVHALMGVNGSGKSTLASILAGRDGYEIESGEVLFCEEDILELDPEERAQKGIFLAFQYPVELPGVNTSYFLRTAVNSIKKANGQKELSVSEFNKMLREKAAKLELTDDMLKRAVNEGFSGGEKKRNEILQLLMLEPRLAILDETDSGLDIDALKTVAAGVNSARNSERSFIVITHYQRLLNYIQPDFVHVMVDGRIVKTGDKSLALELESHGYSSMKEAIV